uniref:Uncharacterized protein n=1 Tax=Helianthus annuus TaxID=4232 RepID=A0A251T6K3_HELAN
MYFAWLLFKTSKHPQAFRCILLELAIWEAGVVMGRDTWKHNTRQMAFTCGL